MNKFSEPIPITLLGVSDSETSPLSCTVKRGFQLPDKVSLNRLTIASSEIKCSNLVYSITFGLQYHCGAFPDYLWPYSIWEVKLPVSDLPIITSQIITAAESTTDYMASRINCFNNNLEVR